MAKPESGKIRQSFKNPGRLKTSGLVFTSQQGILLTRQQHRTELLTVHQGVEETLFENVNFNWQGADCGHV